jgi:hypothetical protein
MKNIRDKTSATDFVQRATMKLTGYFLTDDISKSCLPGQTDKEVA